MISSTILEFLNQTWPLMLISTVVLVTIRITYIFKNKVEFILYKELMMLVFILYIMCLFYIVTYQDVTYHTTSNFIPFKEMFRYQIGSGMFIRQVVGNVFMFAPFGFFLGYLLKLDKVTPAFILSLITSFTIEVTQSKIGRIFDIDDIILNVLGGIIGTYIYLLLYHFRSKLPKFLKNVLVYDLLMIVIISLLVVYIVSLVG